MSRHYGRRKNNGWNKPEGENELTQRAETHILKYTGVMRGDKGLVRTKTGGNNRQSQTGGGHVGGEDTRRIQ